MHYVCTYVCMYVVFTEPSLSPKQKEHRKWKGKVVRKFKRHSSSSAVVTSDPPSQPDEITGTFGIPLDCCCPSMANEVYLCVSGLLAVKGIMTDCSVYGHSHHGHSHHKHCSHANIYDSSLTVRIVKYYSIKSINFVIGR